MAAPAGELKVTQDIVAFVTALDNDDRDTANLILADTNVPAFIVAMAAHFSVAIERLAGMAGMTKAEYLRGYVIAFEKGELEND